MLSLEEYGLYYPQRLCMTGFSDERLEIVWLYFEDHDLDYIDDDFPEFIREFCGWRG